MRNTLTVLHWLALIAMAAWVLVWPPLADFAGGGERAGYLATLAVWLGCLVGLCVLRARHAGGR